MKENDYNAEKSEILCRKNLALGHLKDSMATYNFLVSHKQMPEGIFVDVQLNYKLHMSDTRLIMDDTTWTVMRKAMMRTLRKYVNDGKKALLEYDAMLADLEAEHNKIMDLG